MIAGTEAISSCMHAVAPNACFSLTSISQNSPKPSDPHPEHGEGEKNRDAHEQEAMRCSRNVANPRPIQLKSHPIPHTSAVKTTKTRALDIDLRPIKHFTDDKYLQCCPQYNRSACIVSITEHRMHKGLPLKSAGIGPSWKAHPLVVLAEGPAYFPHV